MLASAFFCASFFVDKEKSGIESEGGVGSIALYFSLKQTKRRH